MDPEAYVQSVDFIYSLDPGYPENKDVGWVYVVRNEEFRRPLLKIGMTTRAPFERLEELSGTNVPGPFELLYFVHVGDARWAEARVHEALAEQRYRPDKEFFDVPLPKAVRLLDEAAEAMPVLRSQRNKGNRHPLSKPIPQAFPTQIIRCGGCGKVNRVKPLMVPIYVRCGACTAPISA